MNGVIAPLLHVEAADKQSHPAKYTDGLLPKMANYLRGRTHILDPFGGSGKVFLLNHWLPDAQIEAIEIEPKFAALHPRTTLGNALALPWGDSTFDAITTSPTYGNRMADITIDDTTRLTYTAAIGEPLHPDNSGKLQWGPAYCTFHERAWVEARRVLAEGGSFVLNIKNHIRHGRVMDVTGWHCSALAVLGFVKVAETRVDVPSMTRGRNGGVRVPYESVIHFVLEEK